MEATLLMEAIPLMGATLLTVATARVVPDPTMVVTPSIILLAPRVPARPLHQQKLFALQVGLDVDHVLLQLTRRSSLKIL